MGEQDEEHKRGGTCEFEDVKGLEPWMVHLL
jgi:hypothetical protein